MQNQFVSEKPTTELFLDRVVDRTTCKKHKAEEGRACFYIPAGHPAGSDFYGAVCNQRAKRAGFNHKISDKSLRINQGVTAPKTKSKKR